MSFSKIVPFLLLIVSMRVEAQPPKLVVPTGHNNAILEFAISSDSRFLASSDIDGVVKIWDIVNGFELMSFTLNRGSTILAFSRITDCLPQQMIRGILIYGLLKKISDSLIITLMSPLKG